MRRNLAVAAGLLLLGLAWGGPVHADPVNPHGNYTATTDGCAGCHRSHSAPAPKLLVNTNTALCLTCHGSAATGALTNVSDGTYLGTTQGTQNAGLNGGGFTNAKQDTTLGGTQTAGATTSIHSVQGMPATADGLPAYSPTAIMWGAGPANTAGAAFDLYCTSCHDPHGSTNYRIIKPVVNGVAVTLPRTDESAKSYTTPTYYAGSATWPISTFCAACHTRYDSTTVASGETSSGDTVFTFQHRMDVASGASLNGVSYTFPPSPLMALPVSTSNGAAPVAGTGDNRVMVCTTCHYSHGSKAAMGATSYSGTLDWPDGAASPSGNARSSLLRLDNRGVCENCHQK